MQSYTISIKYLPLLKKKLKHEEDPALYPEELSYLIMIGDYNTNMGRPVNLNWLNKHTGQSIKYIEKVLGYQVQKERAIFDKGESKEHTKISLTNAGRMVVDKYKKFFESLANGNYDFETKKEKV